MAIRLYGRINGGGGGGGGGGGITSINADATAGQTFSTGIAGVDFALVNTPGGFHTFNLPVASASVTGKLSSTDWAAFNAKIDGIGNATCVAYWQDGTHLTSNIFFTRDPVNGILTNTPGYTTTDAPLTVNRYVDVATGNDGNPGTIGAPWQTINHALAKQPQVIGGIYQINAADGTYPETVVFKDILGNAGDLAYGNNVVKIVGNTATPGNVIIQSGTNPISIINSRGVLVLDGVTLDGNTTSNGCVFAFNGVFDLINVNMQNTVIGVQMNENSRGRWLAGAAGGTIAALSTGITLSRGSSFSLQRAASITGFTGFGISVTANALFGITSSVSSLNITAALAGGIAGIQTSTGGLLTSSAPVVNISNMTSSGNGFGIRCINDSSMVFNDGAVITLNNCTRAGQIASKSYFQDGAAGNSWIYSGGTLAEWRIDSDALIYAPGTFSSANVVVGNQAGYILGTWWLKQGTITTDTTLSPQVQSVKVNGAGPINITLPLSSNVGNGRTFIITDISGAANTNNITLTCSGGDLINGSATFVLNTNYGSETIEAISGGWSVI